MYTPYTFSIFGFFCKIFLVFLGNYFLYFTVLTPPSPASDVNNFQNGYPMSESHFSVWLLNKLRAIKFYEYVNGHFLGKLTLAF